MLLEFEWDEKKASLNETKHGVGFDEATTVFGDPLAITYSNPDHSDNEHRFLTFGQSQSYRLLIVAHTDRSKRVRIISARLMKKSERKIYEEG